MEIKGHLFCLLFISYEILAGVRSSMWRRDKNYDNTRFRYSLPIYTVKNLHECIFACFVNPLCLFVTFTDTIGQCRMYTLLDSPRAEPHTSLWQASQRCFITEAGEALVYFQIPLSYPRARTTCEQFGGYLVVLDSIEKFDEFHLFLDQIADLPSTKQKWWIGGVKKVGGWEWMNGQPMNTSRIFWSNNNPSGNGDCVRIGELFDDIGCHKNTPFVCAINQTYCNIV